jgi:hypothetical protein
MRITITNDGATILKSVPVDNPAAKVLVEIGLGLELGLGKKIALFSYPNNYPNSDFDLTLT